jgi:hypothetical protein
MFGVCQHPAVGGLQEIVPVVSRGGIKLMALNWLLSGDEQANTWLGPLIASTVKHMREDLICGHLWGRA